MNKKVRKILKGVIFGCLAIVIIEAIAILIMYVSRERSNEYVDVLYDVTKDDSGYIAVGVSNFDDSDFVEKKTYEYTDMVSKNRNKSNIVVLQSKIAKYDNDYNLIWEQTFDNKYDSTLYSVLPVSDGYIAVGSYVEKYKQIDSKCRTGLIVKFDKDGKEVWHKDYSVLSDTELFKIIPDDDNFVIIGQSIYENLEVGTHVTGGGIILRINSEGEVLAENNYGGNKSGIFNDILKVDDGYIVCGKDATNYGVLVKFKKDFDREEKDVELISKKVVWQRSYSNTDNEGFKAMTLVNDKIYVVGAINVSDEKDAKGNTVFKYDAGLVIYNKNGKYLGKASIQDENHHRFISVNQKDDKLLLIANTNVSDDLSKKNNNSILMSYSLSGDQSLDNKSKFTKVKDLSEETNYIINKVYEDKEANKKVCIGTENTKCGTLGCEYHPIIKTCEE